MAIDYGMSEGGCGMDPGMGMPDAAMLGNILGDLTAKITVETEEIPDDYTGVPKKTKTVEEVELAELLPGPAPMMMGMGPPPPMMGQMQQMPQMPQPPQMPQQMPQQMAQPQQPGSMGVQAAQSVMQQPF